MMVAPYGLIDSARILVKSLIVQREHLSLLLILLGSLILARISLLIAPIVTLKHFIFLILLIKFNLTHNVLALKDLNFLK